MVAGGRSTLDGEGKAQACSALKGYYMVSKYVVWGGRDREWLRSCAEADPSSVVVSLFKIALAIFVCLFVCLYSFPPKTMRSDPRSCLEL